MAACPGWLSSHERHCLWVEPFFSFQCAHSLPVGLEPLLTAKLCILNSSESLGPGCEHTPESEGHFIRESRWPIPRTFYSLTEKRGKDSWNSLETLPHLKTEKDGRNHIHPSSTLPSNFQYPPWHMPPSARQSLIQPSQCGETYVSPSLGLVCISILAPLLCLSASSRAQ